MKFYLTLTIILIHSTFLNAQEITPTILKKINASEYKLDENNGDGVFVAKHKKTEKWGMFQAWSEKDIKEMIPMAYDSIHFFEFNAKFTGVWNRGKVGVYISPWSFEIGKQTIACIYDDYKTFNVEKTINDGIGRYNKYFTYLAVKKDGLWAWIDWMTGELKTEFIYDLEKEQMFYPEFEQKTN
jgi:hypothetical protein